MRRTCVHLVLAALLVAGCGEEVPEEAQQTIDKLEEQFDEHRERVSSALEQKEARVAQDRIVQLEERLAQREVQLQALAERVADLEMKVAAPPVTPSTLRVHEFSLLDGRGTERVKLFHDHINVATLLVREEGGKMHRIDLAPAIDLLLSLARERRAEPTPQP